MRTFLTADNPLAQHNNFGNGFCCEYTLAAEMIKKTML
jgi:hypothetical protein